MVQEACSQMQLGATQYADGVSTTSFSYALDDGESAGCLGTKLPCRPVQTSLGHMSDIRIQSPDLALDTCLLGTENNRGERPVQLDQEYNIYRSIALPNRRSQPQRPVPDL